MNSFVNKRMPRGLAKYCVRLFSIYVSFLRYFIWWSFIPFLNATLLNVTRDRKGISRSSRLELFCKRCVLRNFVKFTGKHMCQRVFLNKVVGLRPFQKNMFSCEFCEISENNFLTTPPVAASESPHFFTRLCNKLWLLPGCPTLKKCRVLNLKLTEDRTGQIFDRFFEGGKLISDYFESNF